MGLSQLPPGERPRERLLLVGPSALSLAELLAILLRTGVKDRDVLELSAAILGEFGDIRGLCRAAPEELRSIRGLGEAKASTLLAALELARRAERRGAGAGESWRERLAAWAVDLRDEDRERIQALFLGNRDRILGEAAISYGGLEGAFLDARYLLRRAVRLDAETLILAHNHPDGVPDASEEDRRLSRHLRRRLEVLGMGLKGHYVLAGGGYFPVDEGGASVL
jgi:DNA repair protein RadC